MRGGAQRTPFRFVATGTMERSFEGTEVVFEGQSPLPLFGRSIYDALLLAGWRELFDSYTGIA